MTTVGFSCFDVSALEVTGLLNGDPRLKFKIFFFCVEEGVNTFLSLNIVSKVGAVVLEILPGCASV